jgi:hypothetical protein
MVGAPARRAIGTGADPGFGQLLIGRAVGAIGESTDAGPRRRRDAEIERTAKGMRQMFGLSEQEVRDGLQEELIRAIRAEGEAPTIHAFAHSVARILEEDHLRMAEQLERAGVHVDGTGS